MQNNWTNEHAVPDLDLTNDGIHDIPLPDSLNDMIDPALTLPIDANSGPATDNNSLPDRDELIDSE